MINPYSPVNELIRLQEDINRLFAELSGHISGGTVHGTASWVPNVDLSEDSKEFIVSAEVPGSTSDDLQITFRDGHLQIRGEKKRLPHEAKIRYLCLERHYGNFSRTIQLNGVVDIDASAARLHNGILTVVLPKLTNRRRSERTIPVEPA